MSEYKAAVFDFDGTLVDSGPGIINSVIYALEKFGIKEDDREKLKYFIGPPLFDSFRDLYGVSDDDADRLVAFYRERYHTIGVTESRVYGGITELLRELKDRGVTAAICSSKPEVFVRQISENLGFADCIDFISAVTFKDKNADKTPLLIRALDGCGLKDSPECAAMVGDRHFDITAAVNLGVTAVGVTYGFGTRAELAEAGADFIADDAAELKNILMKGRDL